MGGRGSLDLVEKADAPAGAAVRTVDKDLRQRSGARGAQRGSRAPVGIEDARAAAEARSSARLATRTE